MATSVLASIVFLKIQEFSRRSVSEQTRLKAQLEAVVAVTAAELEPASRIVLEASDGAALVVLANPQGALRLATRALTAAAAGLPLSAGLNHGAVRLAGSGKGDEGLVGDGIAVAANVAEFASPSRLLASRAFRDALADVAPGREAALAPAGTFTDAGLRAHELFSPDAHAPRRRRRRYLALSAAAAIALLATGLAMRISVEGQQNFVDGLVTKYRDSAAQGENYVRSWMEKVKF